MKYTVAAPVDAGSSAAVTSETSCGGGFSVVAVHRSTVLDPLTASDDQLRANHMPSAPKDPAKHAEWKRFVTSPITDLISCSDFTLLPAQGRGIATNGMVTSHAWAGNIAQGGSWSAAQATWNVPTITGGGAQSASSQWVGVNLGSTTDPLYQAGTYVSPSEGYKVWTEVWPQQTMQVQRYPNVGDTMQVRVTQTSTGATFDVFDITRSWSFQLKWAGTSHLDGHAEAIDERPTLGNSNPPLRRQYATQNTNFQGFQVYSTQTGWVAIGNASYYYNDMFSCDNKTVLAATQPIINGTDFVVQGRATGVQEACW